MLYLLCTDVDDPVWFTEWVARRHAPDLIEAGFDSASCYRARTGRQAVWDVYEIASADVFNSPAYGRVRQADPEIPRAMNMRSNWSCTLYDREGDPDEFLDAETLVAVRWSSKGLADAAAFERVYQALQAEGQDQRGVTLARRADRQHPLWPSVEPDRLLFIECRQAHVADAVGRALHREWGAVGDVAVIERVHVSLSPKRETQHLNRMRRREQE